MGYLEFALLAVFLLTSLYIWATWHFNTFKWRGIPYIEGVPFIGSQYKFWLGRVSLGDLSLDFYNRFKGKTVTGYFELRMPTIMIRDPNVIQKITTKDFEHFMDHREFTDSDNDPLFNKSLFMLKGSKWKSMRNILTPAFTSSKMKSMFLLVAECGKQLGSFLEEKCKAEKSGSAVMEMQDLFTRYANDVIATSAFGVKCDSLKEPNNEFYQVGMQATNFGGFRIVVALLSFCAPKLMKAIGLTIVAQRVNDFFQTLVRDTLRTREREGIVRPDMLHLLMQARKGTLKGDDGDVQQAQETVSKGKDLTDEDIAAQAFLFFIAGLDTSSTLHCFLSHLLAVHPDVQRRVQEEIDAVLREDGGRLTYEGVVQKTKYLDMVISETLRLWPPVIELDRKCVKDYIIPGTVSTPPVEIKTGQDITIPVFGIHRDPEFYPDPERFDPERFSEENKNNINHAAYLPFGTGPRACIGNRFALMSTKILAVSLLSRFNLEVTSKTSTPLRLQKNTFNVTAEGGFWLAVTPRTKTELK